MNSLYLALRVSTSGDGRRSTPAIKVAATAVALSVAVMLAAIAIVLGFKQEITRKVLGFNPHIVLKTNPSMSNDEYLASLTPTLRGVLDETPYISSYTLNASMPAIFKTPGDFKGVYLRSLGQDATADFLASQLESGQMPDFASDPSQLLISQIAANQLGLQAGDTLPTYFITREVSVRPLKVAGIFNSHFSTYDDLYAYASLPEIQAIGQLGESEGTSIQIYVDDFGKVEEYALDLRRRLDHAFGTGLIYRYYDIETALSNGANFFSWLALLDTNVAVILWLMTAVALITLISGMMILIVDKKRFIAVMKALGASNHLLRQVFRWLTLKVALTGLIAGNAVMLTILLLQQHYRWIPLDAENYYIDFVPVRLTVWSVVILNAAILAVTYIMLLLPSRFVSTIKGTPTSD